MLLSSDQPDQGLFTIRFNITGSFMLRTSVLRHVLLGLTVALPTALSATASHAQNPAPSAAVPVPGLKPFAATQTRVSPAMQAVTRPDPVTTAGIKPAKPNAIAGSLKTGLDAIASGDVQPGPWHPQWSAGQCA